MSGATLESLLRAVLEVKQTLDGLAGEIVIGPQQVTIVHGLSDIDQSLGTVLAGEFRAGNQVIPGDGFSGVRIAYPGMSYGGETWHIAGVQNDVLQFGVRATDGVALAGAGAVTLDANGLTLDVGLAYSGLRSIKFVHEDFGTTTDIYSTANSIDDVNQLVIIANALTGFHSYAGLYAQGASGRSAVAILSAEVSPDLAYLQISVDATDQIAEFLGISTVNIPVGGLNLGTATGAGAGDLAYSGDLEAARNSTTYTGYIFVPLTTPLTSTSYDGDAFSSTAGSKTLIDLSAVFGAPAGLKAAYVYVAVRDSGSDAATALRGIILEDADTLNVGQVFACNGVTNDAFVRGHGIIPCDANGDFYFQAVASGASTLDVIIEIHGYWI